MFPYSFLACDSRQFYHDLFHQPLNQATVIIIKPCSDFFRVQVSAQSFLYHVFTFCCTYNSKYCHNSKAKPDQTKIEDIHSLSLKYQRHK